MNWLFPKEERKIIKETIQNFYNENKVSYVFIKIIFYIIIVILLIYFLNFLFDCMPFSDNADDWGAFGDYIGGALSPILAFASFMALLYTIRLQSEELKATREELARSAKAQENSEKALAEQSKIFHQQQFEATFFSMLGQLNQLTSNINENIIIKWINNIDSMEKSFRIGYSIREQYGTNEIQKDQIYLIDIQNKNLIFYEEIKSRIQEYQKNIDINFAEFNQFSLLLYQILKFIQTLSDEDKEKRYSSIVRACINLKILQLLALSVCRFDKSSYQPYKKLLEKYAFLEHMPFKLIGSSTFSPSLQFLITYYEKHIFGESDYLVEVENRKPTEKLKWDT